MNQAPPSPARRRIVVHVDERRLDLAIPLEGELGGALAVAGVHVDWSTGALLGRTGAAIDPASPVDALHDGEVYTVVRAGSPDGAARVRSARSAAAPESSAVWLLLGAAAVVAVLLSVVAGARLGEWRIVLAVVFGSAALGAGLAFARRAAAERGASTTSRSADAALGAVLPAPLGLGFAAGVLAVPPALAGADVLALASGSVAAALASTVIAASARHAAVRAGAASAAVLLLGLAAVPALGLAAGWDALEAAAVAAGLVPLVLRALPATLLDLPAGMSVDVGRYMSNRWTVRGAVPAAIDRIEATPVRSAVAAAVARLSVGTALLSGVAAVAASAWILGADPLGGDDPVRFGGAVALAASLVLSLLLTPRRTNDAGLRWPPRAAAGAVLLAVAASAAGAASGLVPLVAVLVLLVVAVAVAGASVAISRGFRSLAWSRIADAAEWIAVALSLPAALLSVGVLDLLRGMMA